MACSVPIMIFMAGSRRCIVWSTTCRPGRTARKIRSGWRKLPIPGFTRPVVSAGCSTSSGTRYTKSSAAEKYIRTPLRPGPPATKRLSIMPKNSSAAAGARVADWMWLISALTNDYVLGGWSATMFERFRRKYREFEGVRNLFGLEAQVYSNIETFQGRLDAERDRIGVISGILFGIVAATALVPLGELLVIFSFHLGKNSYANFPNDYPLAFTGIVIGMLGLVGFACWRMLRHAGSLRPPDARSKGRWFRPARRS